MFDNFYVNHRKSEGFLPYIPRILIPEYGQSNAPLELGAQKGRWVMEQAFHGDFRSVLHGFFNLAVSPVSLTELC